MASSKNVLRFMSIRDILKIYCTSDAISPFTIQQISFNDEDYFNRNGSLRVAECTQVIADFTRKHTPMQYCQMYAFSKY